MKITTFDESCYDLKAFSTRLENFIETEHHFVEEGLVLSLNSKFGSGKSTFLNIWRSALNISQENKWIVISLNAWESDYNGEPLFSIVSSMAQSFKDSGKNPSKLLEAAKDFGWFVTALGSQVVNKIAGLDPLNAGEFAEKKKTKRNENLGTSDAFSMFEKRKSAMESLKKAIRELISSDNPRVLFLVDELDRCRPDYAITYLETIKHIFDIKGAVFLLAVDRNQLENSARTAFGQKLDFDEYYRKFVHREIQLPSIPEEGYKKIAEKYINYYLIRAGSRFCYIKLDYSRLKDLTDIISALKLTPRQIQEMFRVLGHLLETTDDNSGRIYPFLGLGCIIMSGLRIGAPQIYEKLGAGNLGPLEAQDFITSLDFSSPEWFFSFLYSGGGLLSEEDESFDLMIERCGINKSNLNYSPSDFSSGWGIRGGNRFVEIFNNIQQISQWR